MILGVIPARSGSKGIINKNVYPLCDKPLIQWTCEEVYKSYLTDAVVTTDIKSLLDTYLLNSHFYTLERPHHLCRDDTPMIEVLKHVLDSKLTRPVEAICLLQPTSPLRTAADINMALYRFKESGASSLYSGYRMGIKTKEKAYDKHKTVPHFQRNGAIFIAKRELIERGQLWDDDVIEFEMPKSRSIDIDDMEDMMMAKAIIEHGGFL